MSAAFEDLDAFLIGDESDLTEPARGDEEHVERLLRGYAWRLRKIAQAEHVAATQNERTAEWLEQQKHRFDPSFHLQVLEGYHRARLADDPKAKTISLPSGTLTARAGQPRWEIDDDTFIEWATKALPDAVRVKHEVDRAALKKLVPVEVDEVSVHPVTANGEALPGVIVHPAEVKFSVKVGDE